jgi:lysozyme
LRRIHRSAGGDKFRDRGNQRKADRHLTRELTQSERRRAGLELEGGTFPLLLVAGALALLFYFSSIGGGAIVRTSPAGRAQIVKHEGVNYSPYWDAGAWAIGIGHRVVKGDGVPIGIAGVPLAIDEATLLRLFEGDLAIAERAVTGNVRAPLTQGQFDALTDLAFNIGAGAFAQSDLVAALNRSDYQNAAAELQRWVYGTDEATGAKVRVPVLEARRADNLALFLA